MEKEEFVNELDNILEEVEESKDSDLLKNRINELQEKIKNDDKNWNDVVHNLQQLEICILEGNDREAQKIIIELVHNVDDV